MTEAATPEAKDVVRMYVVREIESGSTKLVKARKPSDVSRHLIESRFEIRTAKAVETADLIARGVVVENANGVERDESTVDIFDGNAPA